MKLIIALMAVTLATAFTLPHVPEGDTKFMLTIAVGLLIGMVIHVITSKSECKQADCELAQ